MIPAPIPADRRRVRGPRRARVRAPARADPIRASRDPRRKLVLPPRLSRAWATIYRTPSLINSVQSLSGTYHTGLKVNIRGVTFCGYQPVGKM